MVEERRSQQAATGFAYYLGSNTANRYEDGYLVRDFPIKSLYVEEATPPVDELQTFNAVGLSALTVSIHGLCLSDLIGGHEHYRRAFLCRLCRPHKGKGGRPQCVTTCQQIDCLVVCSVGRPQCITICRHTNCLIACRQVAQASQEAADPSVSLSASLDCLIACLHFMQAYQEVAAPGCHHLPAK